MKSLAILRVWVMQSKRNAITNADSGIVQKATGVGKKTAEWVVADLSDKVGLPEAIMVERSSCRLRNKHFRWSLEALIALGYTLQQVAKYKNVDVVTNISASY